MTPGGGAKKDQILACCASPASECLRPAGYAALAELSFPVRAVLDEAGLPDTTIFASGSLDEHVIAAAAGGARIDAFGVGVPAVWEGEFDATTATARYRAYLPAGPGNDEL